MSKFEDPLRSDRLRAARVLGRTLRDSHSTFDRLDYKTGDPVVLVLDQDSISSVHDRVKSCSAPVVLAIYFSRDDKIRFMGLEPGREEEADEDGLAGVGGGSSIGMLYDHLRVRSRQFTLNSERPRGGVSNFTFRTVEDTSVTMSRDQFVAAGR